MKSNPRPKREEHPHPEKTRTESTGSGLRTQQTGTMSWEAHSSCDWGSERTGEGLTGGSQKRGVSSVNQHESKGKPRASRQIKSTRKDVVRTVSHVRANGSIFQECGTSPQLKVWETWGPAPDATGPAGARSPRELGKALTSHVPGGS